MRRMNPWAGILVAVPCVCLGCGQRPPDDARSRETARPGGAPGRTVERAQAGPTGPASTRPTATVAHVVLVWLKHPGDAAARRAIVDAGESLKTIPGVVDVRAGPALPSTRPVVDSSYDVGVLVTFTDEQALQAYPTHPTHLKVLEEILKPNADHYKVYDFTIGRPDDL